jgi:hypothetical protein
MILHLHHIQDLHSPLPQRRQQDPLQRLPHPIPPFQPEHSNFLLLVLQSEIRYFQLVQQYPIQ